MKKLLQRIRGAIGIGVTWAAGWAPIGALTGWVTGALLGFPLGVVTANYAVTFGVLGLIGGTIFSTVLTIAEGRRRFQELSLPRFVAWGALGGLLLGGFAAAAGLLGAGATMFGAVMTGAATLLGAGSAAGTLLIAKAATSQALPTATEDDTRAQLSMGEARPLLGDAEYATNNRLRNT
jgi:hypothetical protein